MKIAISIFAFIACTLLLGPAPAWASQLSYAPVNPTFQPGNQAAGGSLMFNVAQAQKKKDPEVDPSLNTRTIGETVKAAFISRLTSDLYTNVFCSGEPGCQNSGSFNLGDGSSINFLRAGGSVTITFLDPKTGQTKITVPDFNP